jgi:hypothetical protein
MSNEYKQCPNGHYYQGAHCPYCKTSNNVGSATSAKTEVYGPKNDLDPTETIPDPTGPTKTTVVGGEETVTINSGNPRSSARTVFGDEDETDFSPIGGAHYSPGMGQGVYRTTRKLVGWLVSYTLDAMGVDFKLYEGRNIIGRNPECNISVNDNMVSGEHAVLLFRAGKYSITDRQSSHGTFVNGNDIELEPCYLQDGDEIRMGKTLFKFRTSF